MPPAFDLTVSAESSIIALTIIRILFSEYSQEGSAVSAPIAHPKSSRIDGVQFLRFIAFLTVFLVHGRIWCFWGDWPAHGVGALAVQFFILLSGMMTGYTGCGKEEPVTGRSVLRFMGRKLKKLYPLYLWTVIFSLLWSEIPMGFSTGTLHSISHNVPDALTAPAGVTIPSGTALIDAPGQLLRSVLLIQAWFEKGHFSYNGVSWFLSTLMFLYLLSLPMLKLLHVLNRQPKRRLLLGGLLAASLGYTMIYCALFSQNSFYVYTFPPARIGEYLAGMILGFLLRLRRQQAAPVQKPSPSFTLLEAAALACWFGTWFMPVSVWGSTILCWLPANLFLLLVFTQERGWVSRLFACRPLKWLGDISFECYLLHTIIFTLYLEHTHIDGSVSTTGSLLSLLLCLLLTVGLAGLIHRGGTPAPQTESNNTRLHS